MLAAYSTHQQTNVSKLQTWHRPRHLAWGRVRTRPKNIGFGNEIESRWTGVGNVQQEDGDCRHKQIRPHAESSRHWTFYFLLNAHSGSLQCIHGISSVEFLQTRLCARCKILHGQSKEQVCPAHIMTCFQQHKSPMSEHSNFWENRDWKMSSPEVIWTLKAMVYNSSTQTG